MKGKGRHRAKSVILMIAVELMFAHDSDSRAGLLAVNSSIQYNSLVRPRRLKKGLF